MTTRLQSLLDGGVRDGAFPMARAVVLLRGAPLFEGGAGGATATTGFDLSSLTKVMCTTSLFMSLWGRGALDPQTPLESYFPGSPSGPSTFADLLYHRSGLPAFTPLFARLLRAYPRLRDRDCPALLRDEARREAIKMVAAMHLEHPRGTRAVYSDLGFILLGEALASLCGEPLDRAFLRRIAEPLSLSARFHRLSASESGNCTSIAPTGETRPREPAPGQEGLWDVKAAPSQPAEVDDDNAWVMDGVAGHAGLFGTAADVASFGLACLEDLLGARRFASPDQWQQAFAIDPTTPGSTRALGFDTRSANSSSGRFLGTGPKGAVGHLGFTGTSLWIDLSRELVVAICTNRTATGRDNLKIRAFRPLFHDAVIDSL